MFASAFNKMTKLKLLDLFCGCGGISLGFELAGFDVGYGIDINTDAVATFALNFPKSKGISANLSEIDTGGLKSIFSSDKIDVIVGGPPCQGFSSANRWTNEKADPRNKLFFEYLRFVEYLKPKVVVIENVRGILTKDNGFAKNRIFNLLEDLGYILNCSILNAADYGVPQSRTRAFFVAFRKISKTQTFDFNNLTKQNKVTVDDAIGELYALEKSSGGVHKFTKKPNSKYRQYLRSSDWIVNNHNIVYPAKLTQERISHVPQGGNWSDIPAKLFGNERNNRHSSAFKRLDPKDQSVTIDTGNAHSNYFHPIYNRIPTPREAARIQSFPDSFIFKGTRTSQYRQIGNAVPPLLARAVALGIKNQFFEA